MDPTTLAISPPSLLIINVVGTPLNKNFNNLEILPINIGQEKINKIKEFYIKTNIENLDIFYFFARLWFYKFCIKAKCHK